MNRRGFFKLVAGAVGMAAAAPALEASAPERFDVLNARALSDAFDTVQYNWKEYGLSYSMVVPAELEEEARMILEPSSAVRGRKHNQTQKRKRPSKKGKRR